MTDWTIEDMPDQSGKTILITGANSGIGLGAAKELARKGAKVVLAVRDTNKGRSALSEIREVAPMAEIDVMQLDLADLDSVRAFATNFKEKYEQLHVLINNAGIMIPKQRMNSKQGYEIQFATNHLGHFLLTGELLELLERTPNARIVTLSSVVTKMKAADIYFDDLQFEKKYDKMAAYCQSKLANLMFTVELQKKLADAGSSTLSVAAHPGFTATNLQKHMGILGVISNFLIAQKLDMGILPTLRAATDPDVQGGEYYGPLKMGEYRGYPELNKLPARTTDTSAMANLWEVSENLTHTKFAPGM
jgi:NAD(P)-dependent dehydrogenase (short-subunit alcohol dehydrogenase family)